MQTHELRSEDRFNVQRLCVAHSRLEHVELHMFAGKKNMWWQVLITTDT